MEEAAATLILISIFVIRKKKVKEAMTMRL
jgi:hypothetical protein